MSDQLGSAARNLENHMTEQEMEDYRPRYYAGMRAMSPEQMEARALEQAAGMSNARQELTSWQLSQASQNFWAMGRGDVEVAPIVAPLTRWQRLRQWWNECFFKDGADGGM